MYYLIIKSGYKKLETVKFKKINNFIHHNYCTGINVTPCQWDGKLL
jgi:hypothetical protein